MIRQRWVLAFAAIVFACFACGAKCSQAQTSVVFHVKSSPKSPLEVTQIFVDDRPVTPDVPIQVSGPWMGKVTVLVRNVSQKEVIASDLTLLFPETGTGAQGSPITTTVSNLGRWPTWAFRRADGTSPPLPQSRQRLPELHVAPGELMRFDFALYGNEDQEKINQEFGEIHGVDVSLTTAYFADGCKWINGRFLLSTDTPPYWRDLTPDEFAAHHNTTAPTR